MANLIRRGQTWYARLHVPEARWEDVGRALGKPSGVCREVVRTLGTRDHREAVQRRDAALAAMRHELDAALRRARLRPLTDWTTDWIERAVQRRAEMETGRQKVIGYEQDPEGQKDPLPVTEADFTREIIEREADDVEARQGIQAGRRYLSTALGDGLTIAEASRKWLASLEGQLRYQSVAGHRAALALFDRYLEAVVGLGSAETVALSEVTRRMAGEFLQWRLAQPSAKNGTAIHPATVKREFSAFSGLWRWAVRHGYAEVNPWADQMAGFARSPRVDEGEVSRGQRRTYTTEEIVGLLRADERALAPNGGGYAATFFDLLRLLLLTGVRPRAILALTCGDVWPGTEPELLVIRGDKTASGSRVVPLHRCAAAIVRGRLANLPDTSPTAPLWPEVPAQGKDLNRAKTISTRFVAVRRRVLGDTAGLDLYGLRHTFASAAETAVHLGANIEPSMIHLLLGHQRGSLAFDVYSDWSRLASPALRPKLAERLLPLRNAVDSIVSLGMGDAVVSTLDETLDRRPKMLRTEPAFHRTTTHTGGDVA